MRNLLLFFIRVYWFLIPKHNRRKCIFKKSCSHFVYETTHEKGLKEGLKAFRFRFENCRGGFEMFQNPVTNEVQMLLPSKIIVEGNEIAERLLIK
jgi:uncharacterized protein